MAVSLVFFGGVRIVSDKICITSVTRTANA
jgi:hypothetical protein